MAIRIVNLVATREVLERRFPKEMARNNAGIMSADFPVEPERCETRLGRWLAEKIETTRFDDDASRCILVSPRTDAELAFREFTGKLLGGARLKNRADMDELHGRIRAWLDKREQLHRVYGEAVFDYATLDFKWPVFGSKDGGETDSVERYFDLCGRAMRKTGGVILWAGLGQERLPPSLAMTMANNSGHQMLAAYEKQVAAKYAAAA